MAVEILQLQKLLESCETALEQRFTVHKLYAAADKGALLRSVAPRVRAIATANAVHGDLIAALPKLEIIASFGVGYDGVDLHAARSGGIRVSNTPDVLNDAVAEMTIGLMVALARRIPQADAYIRAGNWPKAGFGLTAELTGKTVGIVGLGRIGKEVARRCQAMKMRVVYFGRNPQLREPYLYYDDLTAMARDSDWLVVVAPGGAETRGLVSAQVIEALGPRGMLVNMARGSIVDEAALVEALINKRLAGAALDVFANEPKVPRPLLELDNVVLSPHQGSATRETRRAMGELLVANLVAHFAGQPLPSAIV